MDWLPHQETLSIWLLHYGSFTLFILLALGIIALPVPEETLMVLAGVLMDKKQLGILPTMLAAYGGSICGITISYLLGKKIGHYFIVHYGKFIGLREHHLHKVEDWFTRFGKWTLFVGYFIPGIRHFTGFSAGMMASFNFQTFALYAYTGAIFWASTFLAIGYFSGSYWVKLFDSFEMDLDGILVMAIITLFIIFLFFFTRSSISKSDK
jgi:membrane protein DedA with SNARE-associated domain